MRELIKASWRAVVRNAETNGAVIANAASVAGQYLELASDDPRRAIAMLPKCETKFWALVATHLRQVVEEERNSRGPMLRTGT